MNGFPKLICCRSILCFSLAVAWIFFSTGCGGESDEMVRKKLEAICKSELAAITDSITAGALIEGPYYKFVFYKKYSEGKYSFKAVVDFYFLKKVGVKVVRKYRYHASVCMWDRYSNEYVFLHDTTTEKNTK